MALFFPGKTTCVICKRVIPAQEDVIGTPAFLPQAHRLYEFADAAFHNECFQKWTEREVFESLYKQYCVIWDNRPSTLRSLREIEEWGKEAFKDLFNSN